MYNKHRILCSTATKIMIAKHMGCTVRNVHYYLNFEREGLNNEGKKARAMALQKDGFEINKPKK